MPINIPVTLNWGTLAEAYAPANWQDFVQQLEKILTAYLPGQYTLLNTGNSTPAVDDQDRPWFRYNADGSPDRLYKFHNGKWVAPYSPEPGTGYRKLWIGTLAALYSSDGGDGSDPTVIAPTTTTGSFWEEDTDMRDRIPMGVLAATGAVQTPAALAGALERTLTALNIPEHYHFVCNNQANSSAVTPQSDDSIDRVANDYYGGNRQYALSGSDAATYPAIVGQSSTYGEATPDAISTVPPVIGVYFVKRTARTFWTPA